MTLVEAELIPIWRPAVVYIYEERNEVEIETTLRTDHKHRESIQMWFEKGIVGYRATMKILDFGLQGDEYWVHGLMDGDYADDFGITEPFLLYYHFHLDGHKNEIILLRVDQLAPDEPTMRAVWASSGNMDDPLSTLRNGLWKIPVPGEGRTRVKLAAVGINYHDIFTLRGISMHKMVFPLILGNEGAGTLDDGTEVIIFPLMGNAEFKGDLTLDPDRHVLGEITQGSLADYVVVPKGNVVPKPKNMSFETASVLGVAWLTAYRMLFTLSGLQAGQKMLVQGSSGGVATALIQLGAAAGMEVWVTGRTQAKRDLATKLGAQRTFAPGEQLPVKVPAVFDVSGAETFKHSMESVGLGGTVFFCGLHSGSPFAELDLMKLIIENIKVVGSYLGNRDDFEGLVRFVGEKNIQPYIGTTLPIERAEEGFRMLTDGKAFGKVVIKM
ncbi:NAD(P)-binding protein [Westerdykella ornata]|uniref:NAD(P)-binding protein n=1 Tax=Westerdykella ornata TaxID=318751 RepID=A0A6A6JLQ0_WESOR|nr:NAD(P)-binding protein [Westerdykella ornata]KAF2277174.1 NAD(P)-binding protein [Westerdykella ornata]